jgi:hypothetical protein
MKVAIQGLGEIPTTVELVLMREMPDVSYIICSDYQLKYIARRAGYDKPNEQVIKAAVKKTKTKVIFQKCDVFDPTSVWNAIAKVLKEINPKDDEMIVNYTGGSAVVRLLLGMLGVMLLAMMKGKILYAVRYLDGIELTANHTEELKEIFRKLKISYGALKSGKRSTSERSSRS